MVEKVGMGNGNGGEKWEGKEGEEKEGEGKAIGGREG